MQIGQAFANISGPKIPTISATDVIDHETIRKLEAIYIEFLKGHSTNRGGGAHGHIKILTGTDDDWYNTLTNNATAFHIPDHPGSSPTIPNGASQHQINEATRQHQMSLFEHYLYANPE